MKKTIHNSEYGKLISLLIELRKHNDITQIELAKKINKPQSFVSKYETGERRIDVIEFLEISKAIKANPIKIIKRINSK
jgi:transcriptional regulator with XRE-family HTH domain